MALHKQLSDSIAMHENPSHFVGKTLHDLHETIEYLDRLRTDPVTAGLIVKDCDEIGEYANRLQDLWLEIYKKSY